MHTCMYMHLCTQHSCIHTHIPTCVYIHTQTQTYKHTGTLMCMVQLHIHTYIYRAQSFIYCLPTSEPTHSDKLIGNSWPCLTHQNALLCAYECSHKHICTSSALTHRFSLCMCLHNCTCFFLPGTFRCSGIVEKKWWWPVQWQEHIRHTRDLDNNIDS